MSKSPSPSSLRRSYDGKLTRWLDAFFARLRSEGAAEGIPLAKGELDDFGGPVAVAVLQELLADGWAPGTQGGVYASPPLVAANLFLPVKAVRKYLRLFARAGLLLGVNVYDRGRGRFLPLEVILNRDFADAARLGAPKAVRDQLASVFAETFLSRRDADRDVQGFGDAQVPWGRLDRGRVIYADGPPPAAEAAALSPAKPAGALLEKIREAKEGRRPDAKARREADRVRRAELKEAFVAGCATTWVVHRQRKGFGSDPPAWAGAPGTLPLALRRERADLERVFELVGGRRAAYAWLAFCSGGAEVDEKGRVKFEPALAHRQWATPDKKPSHFAKHLQLVLDEIRKLGWGAKPQTAERLRAIFGEAFEAPPRNAPAVKDAPPRDPKTTEASGGNPAAAAP